MDWKTLKLLDISKPKQWKNLPSSKLLDTGYKVYGANGIIGNYSEYTHKKPTLAITCRGATSGNIHLTEPLSYINSNAMALDEIDETKFDLKFLYYALLIRGLKDTISGSAQPQITRTNLKRVKLNVPVKREDQKRIAQVLSNCENLIVKRKESIRLLDELLKSTYLEMFGDPIRNEKGLRTKPLNKLASISRGKFTPRPRNDPKFFNGKYPFIQTGDITRADDVLVNFSQTLNELGITVSKEFNKGTIVIALVGATIGETAILGIDCYATDSLVCIASTTEEVNNVYIEYVLRFWKPILRSRAPQAARANINNETLKPLPIPIPEKASLEKFMRIVKKIEAIKLDYKTHLHELENLYGSISQKAFKGELDLRKLVLKEIKVVDDYESNFLSNDHKVAKEIDSEIEQINRKFIKPNREDLEKTLKTIIKDGFKAKLFSIEDIEDELLKNNIKVENINIKKHLRNALAHDIIKQEYSEVTRQVMFKLNK